MDLKQTLDNAKHAAGDALDHAKDAIDNAKDAISQKSHEAAADGEREKREAMGDNMSATDKLASNVDEAKNRAQAGTDAAKQDLRNA